MSTANSQTPFLLPTSNSSSISPNGHAKIEKEKIPEPKPNILVALGAPRDHSQHVAVVDGNISNKGNCLFLQLNKSIPKLYYNFKLALSKCKLIYM